jgi:hypothetical protein
MSAKTVRIYKADGFHGKPVEGCEISITYPLPAFDDTAFESGEPEQVSKKEAESIFMALRDNLPGATFDQLLILMLQEKASHFRVSHGK